MADAGSPEVPSQEEGPPSTPATAAGAAAAPPGWGSPPGPGAGRGWQGSYGGPPGSGQVLHGGYEWARARPPGRAKWPWVVLVVVLAVAVLFAGCFVAVDRSLHDIGKGLQDDLKPLLAGPVPSSYGMNLALNRSGSTGYLTIPSQDRVEVLNMGTGSAEGTVPVGPDPTGLALNREGSELWVADTGIGVLSLLGAGQTYEGCPRGSVDVIATASDARLATVCLNGLPIDVAFSLDGSKAYVTSYVSASASNECGGLVIACSGYVTVINTRTFSVAGTITSPASLEWDGRCLPPFTPTSVAITPDGKEVWASAPSATTALSSFAGVNLYAGQSPYPNCARAGSGSGQGTIPGYVYAFSASGGRLLAAIATGDTPFFMTMSRDGRDVYLADKAACTVTEISTVTFQVARIVHLPAPLGCPYGISLGPAPSTVYVATGTDHTFKVGSAGRYLAGVDMATGTVGPVVDLGAVTGTGAGGGGKTGSEATAGSQGAAGAGGVGVGAPSANGGSSALGSPDPLTVTLPANGRTAYVAEGDAPYVVAISTSTGTIVRRIRVN